MDTSLTEAAARDRINAYLLETLQALPAGVGLSRKPDNPDLANLGEGAAILVPCNDSDRAADGPEQVQARYWVVGIPPGQNARYFELIRSIWTGRGYSLQQDADSLWAPVRTPDGYGLVVRYVSDKDHSVSITAGSPCFPKSGEGTTTPQPTEIQRPS